MGKIRAATLVAAKGGALPKANGTAPTETIPFDDCVREGREIVARIKDAEQGQLRLGELADKVVQTKYGDRTLAKFAEAIGISHCTLERHRSVYRAWKEIPAPGPELPSYAAMRALQDHPDRAGIVRDNPKLTKAEASRMMSDHKEGKGAPAKGKAQGDEWHKNNVQWFRKVVTIGNDAIRAAAFMEKCTPAQRQKLLAVVEQPLLAKVRKGGEALVKLAAALNAARAERIIKQTKKPPPNILRNRAVMSELTRESAAA
jgi:hypothetical protein